MEHAYNGAAIVRGEPTIGSAYDHRVARVDRSSRVVEASPTVVYPALVDPDQLVAWLPPEGMTGRFERFDARVGGSYRLVLTYDDATGGSGKADADHDVVEARFVELEPGRRVVQEVVFVSDDPAFAGTMTMAWELEPMDGATRVEITARDVPHGIAGEDHEAGMRSSLENLAKYLEQAR